MYDLIQRKINEIASLTSDIEAKDATLGLMRIILQHLCISITEWIIFSRLSNIMNPSYRSALPLDSLRSPADGTLVTALGEILVAAEQEGWSGISRSFWQPIEGNRAAKRLVKGKIATLERVLQGFVQIRNDGVEGHGISGDIDRDALLDAVQCTIDILKDALPTANTTNGALKLQANGTLCQLQLLKLTVPELNLICYRKIQKTTNGKCVVHAQEQISLFSRNEIAFEVNDVLGTPTTSIYPVYQIIKTYDSHWHPFVRTPERLTLQFTGRTSELDELRDWADDIESRACLLYGDGGIGKTTLAVEFIQRLLEGSLGVSWKPELITFYTAKQTRWGIEGLEILRASGVGVSDVALDIVRGFEPRALDRAWYDKSTESVITKLNGYLQEWGISRDDHLLILDNTETMVTSGDDVLLLAKQIRELSRRVGRILLTSRRREPVDARQIEIKPFEADESVRLLRARAAALKIPAILEADNSTLMKYAARLGNKPLVLEVFIQALTETNTRLDRAFDRVLRMQRQDLGEFLYSDAWNRMSEAMKHLLLLMTRVSDIHDDLLLKLCCQQVGITVMEANEALEESRGIASLSTFDQYLQIAFNPAFLKFCEERTLLIRGITHPSKNAVAWVTNRYNEFLRSQQAKILDRVSIAYRHPLAIDVQIKNLEGGEKRYGKPHGTLVFAKTRVRIGGLPWNRL